MIKKIISLFLLRIILFILTLILINSCGGGGNQSTISIEYQGVAQKGSFDLGSDVLIKPLTATGLYTNDFLKTSVSDEYGRFSLRVPSKWNYKYYEIQVDGFFLSEVTRRRSSDKIKLISITNNLNFSSVNVLTDLAARRTRVLLQKKKSLDDALSQSEKELTKIFGATNIHKLDISQNKKYSADNALMLLLSGALMEVATKADINPKIIINEMGQDFAENGKIIGKGDDWFLRMQATIRNNPDAHLNQYADTYNNAPRGKSLPKLIPLASRPVANVPKEIFAEPGEKIILDGSASHDSGNIINFTWFRVDQQTQFDVPLSDRFIAKPSITVPNQEAELLFSLVVTDAEKLTHTGVVKVIVRKPKPKNTPPVADSNNFSTNEDTPIAITLTGSDADGDSLKYVIKTPLQLPNGILEGKAPNLIYTPTTDFFGTDSFSFKVNDGSVESNQATISITIASVNDRPTAFAGVDQTVTSNSIVTLHGSGWDVEDVAIDVFKWIAPEGITLSDDTSATPKFIAPIVTEGAKKLLFLLITTDSEGLSSAEDTVEITVKGEKEINQAPTADAGSAQSVLEGDSVTLDGSKSSDPEDGSIVAPNFFWTAPTGITLTNPNSANPKFTAPSVSGSSLKLTFTLKVKDSEGKESSQATVTITVNPKGIAKSYTCKIKRNIAHSLDLNDFLMNPNGEPVQFFIVDPQNSTPDFDILPIQNPDFLNHGILTVEPLFPAPLTGSFKYKVKDNQGIESAPAKITIIYE